VLWSVGSLSTDLADLHPGDPDLLGVARAHPDRIRQFDLKVKRLLHGRLNPVFDSRTSRETTPTTATAARASSLAQTGHVAQTFPLAPDRSVDVTVAAHLVPFPSPRSGTNGDGPGSGGTIFMLALRAGSGWAGFT